MTFNSTVFERLLFPLHKQAYRQIQGALDEVERMHPGQLQRIMAAFVKAARTDTQTVTVNPSAHDESVHPCLDIVILFNKSDDHKLSKLRKTTGYKIGVYYEEKSAAAFTGNHLQVSYYSNMALNTFIVPLEYLLGFNKKAVLKAGSYQLYSHTILSPDNQTVINRQIDTGKDKAGSDVKTAIQRLYQKKALIYVGITKQTWQERYRQHCRDTGRGSNLLFHRALRGEISNIGCVEHIVERAGLTEQQAMEMEESEVEKRSLHSLYSNGLNMIPGGYAGLKCVHNFAVRTGFALNGELAPDTIESILADVQRHSLTKHFKTTDLQRINAEIARLWAEDINYRINVMTGNKHRFSYRQIQAARIWHSSDWPVEKILAYLQQLDHREIGMDQLERLLQGKTYASIPDVII